MSENNPEYLTATEIQKRVKALNANAFKKLWEDFGVELMNDSLKKRGLIYAK